MDRDTKKTIQGLTAHVFTLPVEDYLASEKFADFCRKHDLSDAWKECLELSQDEPDLYGSAVTKNAFGLFLLHIFHSRPDEFLEVVAHFLSGLSREISDPLLPDELKKDLVDLGYSDRDLETVFFSFQGNEEKTAGNAGLKRQKTRVRTGKFSPEFERSNDIGGRTCSR